MLKVLLTVDTELWPRTPNWPERSLACPHPDLEEDYERCILGRTPLGDYGLRFILETLRQYDLEGVFFVESLFASSVGRTLLERTVQLIHGYRQEIQLHVHTEWLTETIACNLPKRYRQNLRDFNANEQSAIIGHALENLRAAGVPEPLALRAGNMGGNRDTLRAARDAGLVLDMSFDPSQPVTRRMLKELRDLPPNATECQTIPLSYVEDYPDHYRPAQITALSFNELRHALLEAARQQKPEFVVLLHSFEFIDSRRKGPEQLRPHSLNISRWQKLCEFLSQHRDLFITVGCAKVDTAQELGVRFPRAFRTLPIHTMLRMGEQLSSRLF